MDTENAMYNILYSITLTHQVYELIAPIALLQFKQHWL